MRTSSMASGKIAVRDVGQNENAREGFPPGALLRLSRYESRGAGLSTENLARIQCLRGGVASDAWLLAKVASPDSAGWILDKNSKIHPESWASQLKLLKCCDFILTCRRGGFRLDSPVKVPVASEMPRCAPPYTFGGGEEPCRGGQRKMRSLKRGLPCFPM